MNWSRLAAASTLPILVAVPIAAFCFLTRRMLAGTILGSAVFFLGFTVFAAWDFSDALTGVRLRTEPSIFTAIVVYGLVAMVQAMALFLVSDAVEKRSGDRDRDPAWR